MHFWGVMIDTSAAVLLTVAMGLAVDYSAHITHSFLANTEGSRDERVKRTMLGMGPAVFNGGFSTFLAFSLLMTSKSFVFLVFFKIFFLVVFFGLLHGLIFLPVVLNFIGPKPAATKLSNKNSVSPNRKSQYKNKTTPAWKNGDSTCKTNGKENPAFSMKETL